MPDSSRFQRTRIKFATIVGACIAVPSLMLATVSCVGTNGAGTDSPLIFAAASLADVAEELADSYRELSGNSVRFTFGGSNLAASQILDAGAPADAVWLAGWTPMARLIGAGHIHEDEVATVCFNKIVVVAPGNVGPLAGLEELVGAGSIAIPDQDAAPAGEYARAALLHADVWDALAPQVVPTLDARSALAAAVAGAADFAIVYATDAQSEDVLTVFELPTPEHELRPTYYAAAVDNNEAAADFVEFLSSDRAKVILESHGFLNDNDD